jgi:hypothetical protein
MVFPVGFLRFIQVRRIRTIGLDELGELRALQVDAARDAKAVAARL